MTQFLNPNNLQTILQIRYNKTNITYIDHEIISLPEDVRGKLSENNGLKISYILDNVLGSVVFFMKTKPTQMNIHLQICEKLNIHEREVFFYQELQKQFEVRKYDTSFAPKCFLCKENIIVLEDLKERGYTTGTNFEIFDLSQCESMMKSLAVFHASTIMLEEEKSRELNKKWRLDKEYNISYKPLFNSIFFEMAKKMSDYIIDTLKISPEVKLDMKRRFNALDTKVFDGLNHRKTICHTDLYWKNVMFSIKNNLAMDCCLLDFQVISYFYPAYDVTQALMENTNSSFRNKYMKYLIHYYYTYLSDTLKTRSFSAEEILPLKDIEEGVNLFQCLCRFKAFANHCSMYITHSLSYNIDSCHIADVMVEKNFSMFVKAYQNSSLFKQTVLDDLHDLYKLLKRF